MLKIPGKIAGHFRLAVWHAQRLRSKCRAARLEPYLWRVMAQGRYLKWARILRVGTRERSTASRQDHEGLSGGLGLLAVRVYCGKFHS